MDPSDYESLVRDIAETLIRDIEGLPPEVVFFGKRSKVLGKSGHRHQIDVAIHGSDDIYLIECKSWNNKVGVNTVLTHYGRMVDIQAVERKKVHGAVVTTKGFQKGAHKVARHFEIECHEVRSVDEFSLGLRGYIRVGFKGVKAKGQVGQIEVIVTNGNEFQ